ncbi:MAG: 3-oxoadipate enol-lactonase 2 [Smithella sp. PtaU1.Bin162]|nr:MAG: 3-oxoadipate enol-lactonase 2 [Smithella sp. PtaU1.Bin162]
MKKVVLGLIFFSLLVAPSLSFAGVCYRGDCIVGSFDQTPISYSVRGQGEVTLVFIHGWSCDARYWSAQVPYFAPRYQVVTVDLAGHGHSGSSRAHYTMGAFGEDVKAVVDDLGARRVILIGHSMGGTVAAQAAVLLKERVIGIIGVDTLQNVEPEVTQEKADEMYKPFTVDFRPAAEGFVRGMFPEGADPKLVDWVAADMSSAPPEVATSAMRDLFGGFVAGSNAGLFEQISAPVVCVNARQWPTDEEANRRHMKSFAVTYLDGVGHFLMMEKPEEFNPALEAAVARIVGQGGK